LKKGWQAYNNNCGSGLETENIFSISILVSVISIYFFFDFVFGFGIDFGF